MAPDYKDIRTAARELVARLGGGASTYMLDRIATARSTGKPKELDQAYLLLNEVENLLDKES